MERLPSSKGFLEQYRLDARRFARLSMTGGHTTRRLGQSLDFHDFAPYTPGDDVRHLDLPTSIRARGVGALYLPNQWLIRRFVADERLSLFISIDTRPSMSLPEISVKRGRLAPPILAKVQIALWLAEALAWVALDSKDKVIWHPLFTSRPKAYPIERTAQLDEAFRAICEHVQPFDPDHSNQQDETLNLPAAERFLPPAAVWIILTDFYFDTVPGQQLVNRVGTSLKGGRWILFVDLNTWQYERALVSTGFRRIEGPLSVVKKLNVKAKLLDEVEKNITQHKQSIFEGLRRVGVTEHSISNWGWPSALGTQQQVQQFFEDRFRNDRNLRTIFMREL